MGAPPNEEQMAEMLANPAIAQTMNEALNNPNFIDYMIQSNPTLANIPNAREMLQSPYFRNMMTNPEAIRMAARMRRALQGGGDSAFPAPGATDNTPAAAAAGGDGNDRLRGIIAAAAADPSHMGNFALPPLPPGVDPVELLFGQGPPGGAGTVPAPSGNAGGQAGNAGVPPNPFSALFNPTQAQPNDPHNPFGMPVLSPEAARQLMQSLGLGGAGGASAPAPAPADLRPPEERYADQLRQLNDMGFFDFETNVTALRRSGGSVQGAIEYLLSNI